MKTYNKHNTAIYTCGPEKTRIYNKYDAIKLSVNTRVTINRPLISSVKVLNNFKSITHYRVTTWQLLLCIMCQRQYCIDT